MGRRQQRDAKARDTGAANSFVAGRADAHAPSAKARADRPWRKANRCGQRPIVLFFDLSSMQPEELERAVTRRTTTCSTSCPPGISSPSRRSRQLCRSSRTSPRTVETLRNASTRFGAHTGGFDRGSTGDAEDTPDIGTRSPPTTPSSTSSIPIAASKRCRRWRIRSRASSRRSRSMYFSSGMNQRAGQPGAAAPNRGSGHPRERFDLRRRHARAAGARPGRRRDPRQPAARRRSPATRCEISSTAWRLRRTR